MLIVSSSQTAIKQDQILFCCTFAFSGTLFRQQWKDPYWTRWDKANQLNGDRLVVDDDITSLHYRAIDRRIPMVEKVVDWSRASLTRCRQWRPPIIIMMPHNTKATQHLFALMGVATQLKPIWLLRLRHRVQLYQHYQPSEELR